jgi:hypothetical protein
MSYSVLRTFDVKSCILILTKLVSLVKVRRSISHEVIGFLNWPKPGVDPASNTNEYQESSWG